MDSETSCFCVNSWLNQFITHQQTCNAQNIIYKYFTKTLLKNSIRLHYDFRLLSLMIILVKNAYFTSNQIYKSKWDHKSKNKGRSNENQTRCRAGTSAVYRAAMSSNTIWELKIAQRGPAGLCLTASLLPYAISGGVLVYLVMLFLWAHLIGLIILIILHRLRHNAAVFTPCTAYLSMSTDTSKTWSPFPRSLISPPALHLTKLSNFASSKFSRLRCSFLARYFQPRWRVRVYHASLVPSEAH